MKVRVYELARELGISSRETLALCAAAGVGVTSASAGLDEAAAQAVRHRARPPRRAARQTAPRANGNGARAAGGTRARQAPAPAAEIAPLPARPWAAAVSGGVEAPPAPTPAAIAVEDRAPVEPEAPAPEPAALPVGTPLHRRRSAVLAAVVAAVALMVLAVLVSALL